MVDKRGMNYRAYISRFFFGVGLLGPVLFLIGCGQKGPLFAPPSEAEIRFYRLNEQQQQRELLLVPGSSQAGCHNLPLARVVYRVAQVGFEFCEIFEKSDCAPGTEHYLRWSATTKDASKNQSTIRVTPGAKWLFAETDEVKVGSWSCQLSPE